MIGIGIETSCDETSIGIVKDGKYILSNVVYSQIREHEKFKGVVPEIASRSHLIKINGVFEKALEIAKIQIEEIDYIAITNRPGLIGSLMIGGQFAKNLSLVLNKPLITINHIEAHFYANFLDRQETPQYPFLGVLLSGGNTAIFLVKGLGDLKILGNTQDDAIGEAFDKASSLLGLGYPGGPAIENCARRYKKKEKPIFPQILKDLPAKEILFSYSGIKTSLLQYINQNPQIDIEQVCYSFQEVCFDLVKRMVIRAIKKTNLFHVETGGGVMANKRIREIFNEISKNYKTKIYWPEKKILCTDNGAMIAGLGYYYFIQNKIQELDFNVFPNY